VTRSSKALAYVSERGLTWTLLYAARKGLRATRSSTDAALRSVDRRLTRIEKRRLLTGSGTVSSASHTVEDNRRIWDAWDWSDQGQRWSDDVRQFRGLEPDVWKQMIVDELIDAYVARGSTVLEIGPGAGRWTEYLQARAGHLVLADISARCIEICRERFVTADNIEYHVIADDQLAFVPDGSLDAIWAYDVFVHINPADTEDYIEAFSRTLTPGGVAVIHHAGTYASDEVATTGYRSHLTAELFASLVARHGLEVVEQYMALPHHPGDGISIVRSPRG
jgi:ubiquinone/menaquinone biosynthesis C-methylase UbiE